MKLLISMLALATASPPLAAPADRAADTLVAFADRFDQAQLTKDGAALERMVSDDLVFIDGSGKRLGKRDFIEGWTAPDDRFEPIVLVDRTVTELGPDAGVVGAETLLKGSSGGKSFASRFRFSDTFRRIKGEWRAVHIQVTRMPNP
ncbi:nuclear transport factor 2 family protein [Sphingomonas sp. So64.6b]|uniref:nuclear transport factor 2 family protein n=1 Tax=Sphingomonas sp. So64.6b TaxID=2997354 RepID=UPI00160077B4|nr:nuclear transport factor 2 family protein [Sphingomonas sp. So64.6b]QNA82663.1 nuclear transport factor 2 family protein [Sphingomonas sp. So64.6b]